MNAGEVFLDTNILIYAVDRAAPRKASAVASALRVSWNLVTG